MDRSKQGVGLAAGALTHSVIVALRRIIRAIDLRSRFLVTHYGLTGPQLGVLKELSVRDGVSVGELTASVHLSQATVTGILDRLAKRGLVRRHRSPQDRRRVRVWLTEAGRKLLADAPPLLQEEFTRQLDKLDPREQTEILSALQRVVAMMEARDIKAAPILTTGPVGATPERTRAFLDHTSHMSGNEDAGTEPPEPSGPAASEP